ncbi:hypothetical protein K435DRAFT_809774 [Dendrothele bispora CBS 962.96]|uniref:Uncharacterized protein n=1 Tax=Dendrothele bispora (strain CBS 962.96) TaxID=1314807 RepID=A0A4S8KX53_DENBC|nr:hypothetical protein K435DRAFT_809774 [Dendrothele bispora CBS 962.96]
MALISVPSSPPPLRLALDFLHRRASHNVSIFHVSTVMARLAILAFPALCFYGSVYVWVLSGVAVPNCVWVESCSLAFNVHTLGYIYRWTNQGTFTQKIARSTACWGLIATICIDLTFFFSIDFLEWSGV